jgi:heparan-alpha-glucosaminide N-acetyltransferase
MQYADVAPPITNLSPPARITSIDALRGLVMLTMIFVNDIAAAEHVPWWLKHYSDSFRGSGMTFVDLVFPAFLFIVGMSIPLAPRSRVARGEPLWKLFLHILVRTVGLLAIGIMMVNAESGPSAKLTGWSPTAWHSLMFLAAIFSFSTVSPPDHRDAKKPKREAVFVYITIALRVLGVLMLIWLALVYRSDKGGRLIAFHSSWPIVSIRTEWYGILGLIGWAYFVAALVFITFRLNRLALLGCMVLLLCLFAADRKGAFDGFWLRHVVSIGQALGSMASISVAGVILGTILFTPDTATHGRRIRFTTFFVMGCAAAALLLQRLYGISKNNATPSWCLWSCAITAALWLVFYLAGDVVRVPYVIKPFAIAGQNVLLAYLLSAGMGSWLSAIHLSNAYERLAEPNLAHAAARSLGCAIVVLALTALLNRGGFKLKL